MAAALAHGVVLEVAKVNSAHPCFDKAGLGLDAEQAHLVDGLHVLDGVPRAHDGVPVASPSKNFHFNGLFERLDGGLFAESGVEQVLPAPRLLHGFGDDLVGSGYRVAVVEVEGPGGAPLDLPKKRLLELGHVLLHGLFGGALHSAVDRSVNFQAVGVEVVLASVGLAVGRHPLFHELADVFAQVGRQALVVAAGGEVDLHRNRLERVRLLFGEVVAALHLVDDSVAPVQRGLFAPFARRVVEPWVFAHAHQRGGLFDRQLLGLLAEVHVGGVVNAHALVQKVELVEVHRNEFLFGVAGLELHGDDPFLGLLKEPLESAGGLVEHLLCELLGNGRSAPVAAELDHRAG